MIDSYRPRLYRMASAADASDLAKLVADDPHLERHDVLLPQLRELVTARQPWRRFDPAELDLAVADHLAGTAPADDGVWVHYPWARRIVHTLDEPDFVFLRTNRNAYKITPAEQAALADKRVGVIGLSVGQSIAMTLAMERSFGEIRLADFDVLDLGNLNRLRAGIHQLGLNKAILAARDIAELDPYLRVVVFADGLSEANLDEFFTGGGRLDAVIEECDGLDMKIRARQKARQLGIPVIMETSDRGTLDLERFDLEPDRPLLHGWLGELDPAALASPCTPAEKLRCAAAFAQLATTSPRLKASVAELGHSISTWPQLASAVTLGGAVGADVYRRMMLGQLHASGRWQIDLEQLIADPPRPAPALTVTPPIDLGTTARAALLATLDLTHRPTQLELPVTTLERLVTAATLAPSTANFQPWRWSASHGALVLFHDDRRGHGYVDIDRLSDHLGLGAALENLVLAAHAERLEVELVRFPRPEVAAVVRFHPVGAPGCEPHRADHLVNAIPHRHTDRRNLPRGVVPTDQLARLGGLIADDGGRLAFVTGDRELAELTGLVAVCDRLRLLHPQAHHDFFRRELRWTPAEAAETRDGIDIDTLGFGAADRLGLEAASDPRVVALLADWNRGAAFEQFARASMRAASAVGMLFGAHGPVGVLHGGRLLERVWLGATELGLGFLPLIGPVAHVRHLEAGDLPACMVDPVRRVRDQLTALLPARGDERALCMFRLIVGPPGSPRALRRPISDVLHQD